MHIQYYCNFGLQTGYARAAHDYILALLAAGVTVEIVPLLEFDASRVESRYQSLFPLVVGHPDHVSKGAPTHVVVHAQPHYAIAMGEDLVHSVHAKVPRICYTTWETTEMPDAMVSSLMAVFDDIVTPSPHSATAIDESACHIVPHVLDFAAWPEAPKRMASVDKEHPFVFYSVLSFNDRKNPLGLIAAFLAEFHRNEPVELRIRMGNYSREWVRMLEIGTQIPDDELARVQIYSAPLSHEEYVEFHHAGDCYVTATRGEAWDLPAFEAAAMGKRVLCHDVCTAYRSYDFHDSGANGFGNSQIVYYQAQLAPAIIIPVIEGGTAKLNGAFGVSARQRWAAPDLAELGERMRQIFERARDNNQFHDGAYPTHRRYFEQQFSLPVVGKLFASVLSEHD